jgi:hypothetical protein
LAVTEHREIRAASAGAALVAAYMAAVLLSGRVDPGMFGRLLAFYLFTSFALWLVIGGLWLLIRLHRERGSGRQLSAVLLAAATIRERWAEDRCASLLWPPLLFATLLSTFNAFKQTILPLAGFRFDPLFAAADRALFLGTDPWRITHAAFGSPQATWLIDHGYHGWFLPMSVGLLACAWMPRSSYRIRTQYMLSYIGVWIGIGSILAFLLPSAGPCFYAQFAGSDPGLDALMQRLVQIQLEMGTPLNALTNQHLLLQLHGADALAVGGGISAMPSVHISLAVLFACAAFGLDRRAGWAMAAYAVMIWIGSIHLGWHYAVDGLVAAPLTVGLWVVCGRIADRLAMDAPRASGPVPAGGVLG